MVGEQDGMEIRSGEYFVADEKTHQIWDLMQTSLNEHGFNLDIVYDDPQLSTA